MTTGEDGHVLRFERRLAHPIERVWTALTEPERLEAWWGAAEVELVPGGAFTMTWLNVEDEQSEGPVMHSRITELDPPTLLELSGDLHGVLRFELRPDGDGTVLVFSALYPRDTENLLRSMAGWAIHLEHLEAALAGDRIDWPHWYRDHYPRWQELHAALAARNGA